MSTQFTSAGSMCLGWHLADEVHLLLSQTSSSERCTVTRITTMSRSQLAREQFSGCRALKCGFAGFPFGTDFRVQHFSMNTSLTALETRAFKGSGWDTVLEGSKTCAAQSTRSPDYFATQVPAQRFRKLPSTQKVSVDTLICHIVRNHTHAVFSRELANIL